MIRTYLRREELLAFVGREVVIRRHLDRGGRREGVLEGTLLHVGLPVGPLIPARLREDGGETAVDLGQVLSIEEVER